MRTKVLFAIDKLRAKSPESMKSDQLIADFFQIQDQSLEKKSLFKQFLRINEKVSYNGETDSYAFSPFHDIFNADDLLAYLQAQETAVGLNVRELKDGWNDVENTIDVLEKEGRLLVDRHKKDNHPKAVWANDPILIAPIDPAFVSLWHGIKEERHEFIVNELRPRGMSAAGSDRVPAAKVVKKERSKKKVRHGGKIDKYTDDRYPQRLPTHEEIS